MPPRRAGRELLPFAINNRPHSRWSYRGSVWLIPVMVVFTIVVLIFPLVELGKQRFNYDIIERAVGDEDIFGPPVPLTIARPFVGPIQEKLPVDDHTNDHQIKRPPLPPPPPPPRRQKRYRYSLNFSGQNVRPVPGDLRAFGYGYIDLDPQTPAVCLNFSIVGISADFVSLNGPLEGIGEQSIFSDECLRFAPGEITPAGRYETCISITKTATIGNNPSLQADNSAPQGHYTYGSGTNTGGGELLYRCQRETSKESITSLVRDIISDPSRYYLLLRTPSKPMGSLWSNFGGQWGIPYYPEPYELTDDSDDDLHDGNHYYSEQLTD